MDLEGVSGLLFSIHGMLAAVVKIPELALDPSESKMLASGILNVQRHYDIALTAKAMDWANLGMIVATVYGTRAVVLAGKARERRAAQPQQAPKSTAPEDRGGAAILSMPGVRQ